MIDYPALQALASVIELQSFELAAKKIGISQSAVSQRIHGFESHLGERLLIRKLPYQATAEGEKYLSLFRKVRSLEHEVQKEPIEKPVLKLAINRDSLDLFFLDVLSDSAIANALAIEVLADDQENTLGYLKNGQVDMCISSQKHAIPNHTSTFLGSMTYILACSPKYAKQRFNQGVNRDTLSEAHAIIFDHNDRILGEFLKDSFDLVSLSKVNKLPSVSSFRQGMLSGFGFGLIPLMDVESEIRNGKLVNLTPKKTYSLPLYLHQWEYQKAHVKIFNDRVMKAAKHII